MKKSSLAPIALFVYNRLNHTQQTIAALQRNNLAENSDLIIFSDGSKDESDINSVSEVRSYIKSISGFNTISIIEREVNLGLSGNIIDGVNQIFTQSEKIIVIEDDLVTSSSFLIYMNENLDKFSLDNRVGCIHGYMYPIKGIKSNFFIKGADCWGWGTWKRAWSKFEKNGTILLNHLIESKDLETKYNIQCGFSQMLKDQIDGKNDSWAIRWYFSCVKENLLCLYPHRSLVLNIGNDGSGTHSAKISIYDTELRNNEIKDEDLKVEENLIIKDKIREFHVRSNSFFYKIFQRIFRQ